jgi:GntR family transcriptional regulator
VSRPRARHAEVAEALRWQIEQREILPGDLLPSEGDLCVTFRVSRSVIRQALATLQAEGLVKKSIGRGTTVLVRPELHRDPRWLAGLSAQMAGLGSRVATKVLSFGMEDVPTHVRGLPGSRALRIERLRFVDGEPTAFIRTWLTSELRPAISRKLLMNGSLHDQLRTRAGVIVSGERRQIRAISARAPIDGLLEVAAGAPLLLLEGESRDQHGRVVEAFSTWHRSDKVAFDVTVEDLPGAHPESASSPDDARTALVRAERALELALRGIAEARAKLSS